ncbi:type II toxin-antitoxin system Phd/YefM family antitoxin [Aquipuribacter sp. MA13-6]|uniref:type II toxin-antitoxin system Phd/YefM family antitoxin n=1 Tax=unclassified Aquipuribacter TaxID=2635084 RepID=UPI003EEF5EE7
MTEVGVHDAKTRLSELLREVEAGGEVVVTRGGRAVARLVPVEATPSHVDRFGLLAAEIEDPGDWADEDEMADLFGIPLP